eukprot:5894767-Pyramimonas_sp.AAC.1
MAASGVGAHRRWFCRAAPSSPKDRELSTCANRAVIATTLQCVWPPWYVDATVTQHPIKQERVGQVVGHAVG